MKSSGFWATVSRIAARTMSGTGLALTLVLNLVSLGLLVAGDVGWIVMIVVYLVAVPAIVVLGVGLIVSRYPNRALDRIKYFFGFFALFIGAVNTWLAVGNGMVLLFMVNMISMMITTYGLLRNLMKYVGR